MAAWFYTLYPMYARQPMSYNQPS